MKKIFVFLIFVFSFAIAVDAQISDEEHDAIEKFDEVFTKYRNYPNTLQNVVKMFMELKTVYEIYGGDIENPNVCFNYYKNFNTISSAISTLAASMVNIYDFSSAANAISYVSYAGEASAIAGVFLGRAAEGGHSQAIAIVRSSLNQFYNPQPFQYSAPRDVVGKKICTLCNGRGWIPGNKTPTYGNMGQHYCNDCHEWVGASHSHDICPSCNGTGVITSIK